MACFLFVGLKVKSVYLVLVCVLVVVGEEKMVVENGVVAAAVILRVV